MEQQKWLKTATGCMLVMTLLLGLLVGCGATQLASNPSTSLVPTTTVKPTTAIPTSSVQTVPTTTQNIVPTTVPTAPPAQPTEPSVDTNPVPEHLRNNYYLTHKGQGGCDVMTGEIMVFVIFVSDKLSKWDAESIESAKLVFADHEANMEAAAVRYGAQMNMSMMFLEATISLEFELDSGKLTPAYNTMKYVDMDDAFYDQDVLETQYNVDSAPVIFVLNRPGRAYAVTVNAEYDLLECAVIYGADLSSVRHEVYHIFGALDFYFPDDTIAAMNKYLPTSIMYNHYRDVDDLTAYLIGWTDELSENALNFLEATNHLTKEEIEEAQAIS